LKNVDVDCGGLALWLRPWWYMAENYD